MINLDEIFINLLSIFLIELKFLLLYCINRITPGHRITLDHLISLLDMVFFRQSFRNIWILAHFKFHAFIGFTFCFAWTNSDNSFKIKIKVKKQKLSTRKKISAIFFWKLSQKSRDFLFSREILGISRKSFK